MGKKTNKLSNAQSELKQLLSAQGNLNYKMLKRHVVARGMPFNEVVSGDIPRLSNWLRVNAGNKIDTSRLDAFDDWVESQIEDKTMIHPMLRLGYIGEKDEDDNVITTKKVKGFQKTKVKRERTESGIFSGTKKALTFELVKKGLSKAETIEKVLETFPDAKPKSIGIWYKKAKK